MPVLDETLLDALDDGDPAEELLSTIERVLRLAPPTALERAAALYVWKRAWESALPASRHGGDRRSSAWRERDQDEKISFSSVAAAAIGVGERQIQLDIALAEALGAGTIRLLWTSPIADNASALKSVAAYDPVARARLLDVWRDNPALTFARALQAARLAAAKDADETSFRRLIESWTRAGSKARRRFLDEIGIDASAAEAAIALARKAGRR